MQISIVYLSFFFANDSSTSSTSFVSQIFETFVAIKAGWYLELRPMMQHDDDEQRAFSSGTRERLFAEEELAPQLRMPRRRLNTPTSAAF